MRAINIEWDVSEEEKLQYNLPDSIRIPDGMTDMNEISDYISDEVCFCHKGFALDNES